MEEWLLSPTFESQMKETGSARLKAELAESRMIIRPATKCPLKAAVVGAARQVVDAGIALPHQAAAVKLPILVPERSEPVPAVVVPLIGKPNGDTSVAKRPKFLDQTVVELPPPFCREERGDRFPSGDELGTVRHWLSTVHANATLAGSRLFHPSSAVVAAELRSSSRSSQLGSQRRVFSFQSLQSLTKRTDNLFNLLFGVARGDLLRAVQKQPIDFGAGGGLAAFRWTAVYC